MYNIGNKIKNRRQELGLTLEEVGNAVKVGRSTVQRWESGLIKNMGRDKIAALARILQMDPVELVPGPVHDDQKNNHYAAYNDPDDMRRLEALHQDPSKGILFDRVRNMPHEDVEKIMQMIDLMFPKDGD